MVVFVGLVGESPVVQEYILLLPTAFRLWCDADRVALKRRLHSRAEAGRFEAWISMREATIKIEKLVSKSVHLKGPVSPMGPMIHEFDEDTE
jgi:hypothetical protein